MSQTTIKINSIGAEYQQNIITGYYDYCVITGT